MWIKWQTVKHTDGRRPSGVGYNKSIWHWRSHEENNHTACGREIGIISRARHALPVAGEARCVRCRVRYNQSVPARPVEKPEHARA